MHLPVALATPVLYYRKDYNAMNWISVTEKMPPEYRELILSINLFGKEYVIFGYYTGREFFDDDNFLIGDNEAVTAWMLIDPHESK